MDEFCPGCGYCGAGCKCPRLYPPSPIAGYITYPTLGTAPLAESDVRRLIRDELSALVSAVVEGVQAWAISEAQYGDVDAVRRVLRGARIAAGEYGTGWLVDDEGNRV